jgi:hypothetical protein
LSSDDIAVAQNGLDEPPIQTWNTWSKDLVKKAVIVAITSRLGGVEPVGWDMLSALVQGFVRLIHYYSLRVEEVHC